jgi:hypothetical protein
MYGSSTTIRIRAERLVPHPSEENVDADPAAGDTLPQRLRKKPAVHPATMLLLRARKTSRL